MIYRALLLASTLAPLATAASAGEAPIVRYTTWMIVGPGQMEIESRSYGTMHDDFVYRDQPTWSTFNTAGDMVERIDARLGATTSLNVEGMDLALLRLQPGRNYAVPRLVELDGIIPWTFVATEQVPLHVVDGFEALYFWLPPGLTAGSIMCHAFSPNEAGKLVVSDLNGNMLASVESDFLEPEALLFRTRNQNPDGQILQLAMLEPENPDWILDDATIWLGGEIPGLLTPSLETALTFPELARRLGIRTSWTPMLDFEGDRNPIRTIQWSRAVPEGAELPAYDVSLSSEETFSGDGSLRVELRFPEDYEESWQEIKLFTQPLEVDDVRQVRFYLHGDGSGRTLRVRVRDESHEHHYVDAGTIDWKGWKAVVADFENQTSSITGGDENKRIDGPTVTVVFHITHTAENPLESVLYIDDLAVQAGDRP